MRSVSFGFFGPHWRWFARERGAGVDRDYFDHLPSVRLGFHSGTDGRSSRDGHIASGFQNRNVQKGIADAPL
jgi:hypothetical protein